MSTSLSAAGQKRKAPLPSQPASSHIRKRQKFQDARAIPAQTADAALSKTGELNIGSFIKSREYEIKALDKSMQKARQNLSSRAFQQVPRHLRRRTASHNVKKVPRRLRSRAKQEMIEDNTPTVNSKTRKPTSRLRLRLETAKELKRINQKRKTVRQKKKEAKANATESDPSKHVEIVRVPRIKKNKLANPPLATSKFKRRQVNKSWLPTHLWHSKRAHMTKSMQPLWRMAIPLRPTEKSYRATHRASESRGCIAWDMSYISTISCLGTSTALESMLKAMSFHGHGWSGQKYNRWKSGSRFAGGWISRGDNKGALAMVDVLWSALQESSNSIMQPSQTEEAMEVEHNSPHRRRRKTKLDHRIMIRIHPSAFHEFWAELLHVAKIQKPQVLVEDLRFEIGSIEITGPASTEALTNVLTLFEAEERMEKLWSNLRLLSNTALLPANAMLGFNIQDPRLSSSSRPASLPRHNAAVLALHELATDWPLDNDTPQSLLFSHRARHMAGKLPSQWTLSRRRQEVLPGQALQVSSQDPKIPLILLAHRPAGSTTAQQGTWTLLCPWKCVDVIWRKLLFCALSSGSKPRFGGLHQKQQVAFEQCVPWYPGDFPGTEAGKAWERSQAMNRFDGWIRRPQSRRIAWERLDLGLGRRGELGRGWTCDWEYLFTESSVNANKAEFGEDERHHQEAISTQPLLTQRQRKDAKAKAKAEKEKQSRRRNTSSPEDDGVQDSDVASELQFIQLMPSMAKPLLQSSTLSAAPLTPALVSIKVTLLSKGTPKPTARIYRIPMAREQGTLEQAVTARAEATAKATQSNDIPPSAQPSLLPPPPNRPDIAHVDNDPDLRSKWLSLDSVKAHHNVAESIKKEKRNRWGLLSKPRHYETESLRHINVLPKDPLPEIYDQYGPKAFSDEDRRLVIQKELAVLVEEKKVWDTHTPCPGAEDLIGFVTSGGYNLAEGKGTAIGAIWLQRLLQGWALESIGSTVEEIRDSQNTKQASKTRRKTHQRQIRERHLCVVRNAGESVGRLAVWELCA